MLWVRLRKGNPTVPAYGYSLVLVQEPCTPMTLAAKRRGMPSHLSLNRQTVRLFSLGFNCSFSASWALHAVQLRTPSRSGVNTRCDPTQSSLPQVQQPIQPPFWHVLPISLLHYIPNIGVTHYISMWFLED